MLSFGLSLHALQQSIYLALEALQAVFAPTGDIHDDISFFVEQEVTRYAVDGGYGIPVVIGQAVMVARNVLDHIAPCLIGTAAIGEIDKGYMLILELILILFYLLYACLARSAPCREEVYENDSLRYSLREISAV